jgi:hypothetical protein
VCSNRQVLHVRGCGVFWDRLPSVRPVINGVLKSKRLGRRTGVGESPVDVDAPLVEDTPSSAGLVEFRVNLAGPPVKPEYSLVTDSG